MTDTRGPLAGGQNIDQLYPLTPVIGHCTISTANTALDGTGLGFGVLAIGGPGGSPVSSLKGQALESATSDIIHVFLNLGQGAKFYRNMPAQGSNPHTAELDLGDDFTLPEGAQLLVTTDLGKVWNIFAHAANYAPQPSP